jgi:hypothetical protein
MDDDHPKPTDHHWQPPTTPKELEAFIKAQGLLEHMTRRPCEKLDVSLLLLKTMAPTQCSPCTMMAKTIMMYSDGISIGSVHPFHGRQLV